jgi:5-methylcytosine-specific restriction endonuclease McrA
MQHLRENGRAEHRRLVRRAQEALSGPDLSGIDSSARSITPLLRSKVLVRDGLVCQECGRELHDVKNLIDDRKATVDHIVPRCLGGGDDLDNLRCLCHRCNSAQGKTYGGLPPVPGYLKGYAHQISGG